MYGRGALPYVRSQPKSVTRYAFHKRYQPTQIAAAAAMPLWRTQFHAGAGHSHQSNQLSGAPSASRGSPDRCDRTPGVTGRGEPAAELVGKGKTGGAASPMDAARVRAGPTAGSFT